MQIREIARSLNTIVPSLRALVSNNSSELAQALKNLNTNPQFLILCNFLEGLYEGEMELSTQEKAFSLQGMSGADPSGQIGPITDQVLPPTGPGVVQGIMRPKKVELQGEEKKDAEKVRKLEQDQSGIDPEEQTNEGDSSPTLTEMNLLDHPIEVPQVFIPPENSPAPYQQSSGIDDDDRDYGDNDQSASSQIMMDDGEERLPLTQMAEKHNKKSNILKQKLQNGLNDREALGLDKEQSAAFPGGNLDGSPPDEEMYYGDPLRQNAQSSPTTEAIRRNLPYGESLENDTMPLNEDYNDQPWDVQRGTKPWPEDEDTHAQFDNINQPQPMERAGEGDPVSGNPESPDGFPPFVENEGNSQLTRGPSQSGTASNDKGKGPDNFDEPEGLDSNLRDNALPDPRFGIDQKGVI